MTLVFLTNKLSHGAAMLRALEARGIVLDVIILEDAPPASLWKQIRRYQRKLGAWGTARYVVKTALKRYVTERHLLDSAFYAQFGRRVARVPNVNGEDCAALLRDAAPDVLILGGSRILKDPILQIPRTATLNAHPGLLPAYRGVDTIPWALHNGDPLGVTVHAVDAGVDTGGIVAQRNLPIDGARSVDALRRRAETLCGDLMAAVVSDYLASGHLPITPQDMTQGQQYYKMPRHLLDAVNRELKRHA